MPLCLDRLVRPGIVTLSRMVELLSTGPARTLGIPGGTLEVGSAADLTLLDLNGTTTVEPETLQSKSRNTPFGGFELHGRVAGTILGGRPIEL